MVVRRIATAIPAVFFSVSNLAAQPAEVVNVTTKVTTPLVIEGLTNDAAGNLYTTGRQPGAGVACPVWRIDANHGSLTVVGTVPAPSATEQCNPAGLAFNLTRDLFTADDLFIADGDRVYRLTPNAASPPVATLFAAGVPGANGIAFDRWGNLWVSDGSTGLGRVWRVNGSGLVIEVFRVQAMANEVNVSATGEGGVGRDVRSLPPGTVTVSTTRSAANTAGSQPIVANGLAFERTGDLLIADTARGAIWRARFDRAGNLRSRTGCDTTFSANTLCLDNVFVEHPYLEGVDGITLDRQGNIWASINERNAIVLVTPRSNVLEVFRNAPDPTTRLRNAGPLEFPTSPVVFGDSFCTANSDGNRRDNSPSTAGQIGGAGANRGKVSCFEAKAIVPKP